jgi:hypothetical protein
MLYQGELQPLIELKCLFSSFQCSLNKELYTTSTYKCYRAKYILKTLFFMWSFLSSALHFLALSCPSAPLFPLKIPPSPSPVPVPPVPMHPVSFPCVTSCLAILFHQLYSPSVSFRVHSSCQCPPVPLFPVPFPLSYLPVQYDPYLSHVLLSTLSLGPVSLSRALTSCHLSFSLWHSLLSSDPFPMHFPPVTCPLLLSPISAFFFCFTLLSPVPCPVPYRSVPYPVPYPPVPCPLPCSLPSSHLSPTLCPTLIFPFHFHMPYHKSAGPSPLSCLLTPFPVAYPPVPCPLYCAPFSCPLSPFPVAYLLVPCPLYCALPSCPLSPLLCLLLSPVPFPVAYLLVPCPLYCAYPPVPCPLYCALSSCPLSPFLCPTFCPLSPQLCPAPPVLCPLSCALPSCPPPLLHLPCCHCLV